MDAILKLFPPKIIAAQIAAILFAIATWAHVTLPTGFTPDTVAGFGLLVFTLVTAVLRFGHGNVLADAKAWWLSKTIWMQIIGVIVAGLVLFGITPKGINPAQLAEVAAVLIGLVTTALHVTPSKPIG
ncbi:hypothetical protein [Sphingomonas sp. SRS2]|uniref:hypothetical protein n=1 Tax=Sphingomonas sp. SRS2 TaxID=133190 RepID=UPI00061840CC|nr:hypothetical protein [Sphingomonas sp. SRS2]KKC24945.1 hypothetical protein WP12_17150 [Sphingomonas sp. SRS2]